MTFDRFISSIDKESEKKEAEKDSHFHQILEKFEKSDSAEKGKRII